MVRALSHVLFFFNPDPVWRVPIPNRDTAKAKFGFGKNNKRRIIVVTSLLHRAVEGPVADDRMSSFPQACCCWQGMCREGLRRRGGRRRAGPGRGPQPAVWRGAAVLRRLWPPSPCRGAAPCGLCLVAGQGGWCCCCGAATHAARSVGACNRGPPSSASASTSGLSRPVLPRRL